MPSPIYQYMISLVVSLPIIRGPGEYSMQELRDLNNFFNVAKLTILTPLFLLS